MAAGRSAESDGRTVNEWQWLLMIMLSLIGLVTAIAILVVAMIELEDWARNKWHYHAAIRRAKRDGY